jgi:cytochrome c oxidase accessory protein FixG
MSISAPSLESAATINADGSRRFIHPSTTRGVFSKLRAVTGLLLLGVYAALPWIPINGHPAVFLDVASRRFHLFGLTLVTQDLWLGFFLITGTGFGLFYLTALLGRVWCGWVCPQTVFLDVVRRIERLLEGDAPTRRRLDAGGLSALQSLRRGLKQVLYAFFALALAHVFLSYFVSLPRLWKMMATSPAEHWSAFLFVFAMAAALWFDFAWFREQFCIVLCPYGRLQSVLMDNHTITVGYDAMRGEPRGKKGTPDAGACVDCSRCVQVCPTGIDIRQGTQIECIACAACVDACNDVMAKLQRPPGLIRYDSANGFAGGKTRFIRPRTIVYTILLAVGATVAAFSMSTFRQATVSVLRMPGAPYYLSDDGVRNQFLLRIINKENRPEVFQVRIHGGAPGMQSSGTEDLVATEALAEQLRPLVVTVPRAQFHPGLPVTILIDSADGHFHTEQQVPILGPSSQ